MRTKARREKMLNPNNILSTTGESGYIRKENTDKEILKEIISTRVQQLFQKKAIGKHETFNGRELNYKLWGDIPQKTKDFVYERDNFECGICKNEHNLHIHHIVKRVNGGSHNHKNLMLLCDSCHGIIENNTLEKAIERCFSNALKYYYTDNIKKKYNIENIHSDLTYLLKLIISDEDLEIVISELEDIVDNVDNQVNKKLKQVLSKNLEVT